MRPQLTNSDALSLAKSLYGIHGTAKELVSYSDQNFLVTAENGERYVLKITNASEPLNEIEFQQGALMHLRDHAPHLSCPTVIPMVNGTTLTTTGAANGAGRHAVWMVGYQPGRFVSELTTHSWELCYGLGAFLGRLDKALESYTHPAMNRFLQWDLMHADRLVPYLEDIEDEGDRALVQHFLERFTSIVQPRCAELPASVIHNDANDNNILVGKGEGGWQVKGIIDFGDMVCSCTIGELAIAIAYMILDKEDIMGIARAVAGGYHEVRPMDAQEIDVLFDLVCTRLSLSVCMSARERKLAPDNAYLAVSEASAWNALRQLRDIDPGIAGRHMHDALR